MYKNSAEVEKDNEMLRIALSHVNVVVFEFDTNSRKIKFFGDDLPPFNLPNEIDDGVNYILNNNVFEEVDKPRFKHLFTLMEQGEEFAGDFFKPISSQQLWYNLNLANCMDENNKPCRVIGTFQDVTARVMGELHYSKEEQFRLAMLADSRRVYEINVTKDRFMALSSIEDSTDYGDFESYTKSMDQLRRSSVYREDWDAFSEVAERDNLLYYFSNGKTEFYCEYRKVNKDGSLIWSSSTTHLLRDPLSNDIKGFIYVKDIDTEKKQEILLHQQAEEDPLTGIYNRGAAKKYIEDILISSVKGQLHGFMSIDIDEFKTVNDTYGHLKGDFLLQEMAKGFQKLIRNQDVLARMGGDEFIIFLNNVNDLAQIKEIANRLKDFVEHIVIDENSTFKSTVSIGIAVFPTDGLTFEELYKNSDSSLYHAKHSGKNCISSFS